MNYSLLLSAFMNRYFFSFIFLMGLLSEISAQVPVDTVNRKSTENPYQDLLKGNRIVDIQFSYTFQSPDGDLAKRFGDLHQISAGVFYKTQNHWLLSAQAGYQFGYYVREPGLFYFLTNSSGWVMNLGGYPANYTLGARGANLFLGGGRIFPLSKINRNSGILIHLGGGYAIHKINIFTETNNIPSLTPELKRGYDRLSAGYALDEFIGYYFHSENRYINFYVGFAFSQAFTKSLRGFNYDTRQYDTKTRNDLTNGFRFGWMIPIYLTNKNQTEFEFR